MTSGHDNTSDYEILSRREITTQGEKGILETKRRTIDTLNGEKEFYLSDFWYGLESDNSGRVKRSWMPKEYFGKTLSAFDWTLYPAQTKPSQELAVDFINQYKEMFVAQHRGLYIYSAQKGSGKTLLACCLANEVAKKYDCNIKFVSETDYLDQIKNEDFKKACKECQLLVLDDFGVSRQDRDWITSALYGLINYRNSEMRTTIITSNVPYNAKNVDDRIMSRIREMCLELRLPEYSVREALAEESNQRFRDQLRANRQVNAERTPRKT